MNMKILGIETSCDETAVCLIEAFGTGLADFSYKVLGNALYSQVAIHAPYGGVFPNLAKREHAKNLVPLMRQTLEQADILEPRSEMRRLSLEKGDAFLEQILAREPELLEQLIPFLEQYDTPDIDAIAVTVGPGLEPALWVGVNFARALSTVWDVPIVAVNHMEGHILASMITPSSKTPNMTQSVRRRLTEPITFPLLSLLISGGHTELVFSKEFMHYECIGETRDDAVGEAFDKVARLLDLPYPGGPEISRLAREAREQGLISDIHFTPPMIHSGDYDFSFSGIKTEVRKLVAQMQPLTKEQKMHIARAFEDAVAHVLVAKTIQAAEEYGVQTIIVGGGVSANTHIRTTLIQEASPLGLAVLVPPSDLATDNAIMIALAGYVHAIRREFVDVGILRANGNLRLVQ
jgi:N6-L-threonylcarbamoyladenine synthase